MDTANLVNSIGLVLDIIGAALIFSYGLPKWVVRDNETLILDGGDARDREPETKLDSYTKWNRVGLAFLIAGFIMQLISNFVPAAR